MQVLYVDDDPDCLKLVKIFLEESGDFAVDTTTTVREAAPLMATKRYDVVVSDYSMPDIDGLEFLRMVRQKDRTTPFILFSGRSREEVIIEAYNQGVSFYVEKEYDLDIQFAELMHKIRQAAARHEMEEHLRTKQLQAKMAIDLARIASWEYDPRTNCFWFDDIFYELLGTTAEREGGHYMTPETYLREFVYPEDLERSRKFMQTGSDGWSTEFQQTEHRMVRRDGEVRRIVVRVGRLKDAYGNVLKVVGVNQDITGR